MQRRSLNESLGESLRGSQLGTQRGSRRMSLASLGARIILGFVMAVGLAGCKLPWSIGYNTGYSPEQPLPFSHELHAGKHQIQCLYCHNQAERSPHAMIPALSTCMNCHLLVKADSPFIQKLKSAYDKGASIEWVRVHMLPDHVKFNHSIHLARGVNCETCHGAVEKMTKLSQVRDLSMGMCVECHRLPENKASTNCSACHN